MEWVVYSPFIILGLWISLPIASYFLAKKKGRSAGLWALFVALFPPLFIFPLLLNPLSSVTDKEGKIRCPKCREWVYEDAEECRFCGEKLPYKMRLKNSQ